MKIKILGTGCINCDKLYEETLKAVENLKENIDVEYVSDMKILIDFGVIAPPAMVINDKLIFQGKSMKVKEIEKLIKNYK